MMSHPAAVSFPICATVAATSCVFVFVMDWISMGFPAPITLSPIATVRVILRVIVFSS
jgi:hypothetical protein